MVAALIGLLTVLAGCGSDPADPKSPEQVLLDKAIKSLWGDVSPESIQSLQTHSTLIESQDDFSSTFELDTLMASANSYREIRQWKNFGVREEFIQGPKSSWHVVDGAVVDLKMRDPEDILPSQQSWLFEISKLAILKDTERFDLKHRGHHKNDKKEDVERLEVHDKERPNITLTFDFAVSTGLIAQVTLEDDTKDMSFTLILRDYRPIEGIQFAHEIDSLENGKPHAQQRGIVYQLNPTWKPSWFAAPKDLKQDRIISKQSIGGSFAYAQLAGGDEEIPETISNLKKWIEEKKLEINGPLIVIRPTEAPQTDSRPTPRLVRVAIAVKVPDPAIVAQLGTSETFGLIKLVPGPVQCVTEVGNKLLAEIRKEFLSHASPSTIKSDSNILEIYFSPEGTIRQVQFPVN